jgi:plasmid stabilization system protein ParE
MPHRRVEYEPLAERDIESAVRWYIERNSPQSAARFLEQVRETVRRIGEDAEFFPILSRGVRWVKLPNYNYTVNYLIVDDRTCRIYSVSHTSRRPRWWYRRLPRT